MNNDENERFNSLTQSICNKMELVRMRKGMTQKQLAERMGRYPSQISVLLNGDFGHTVRLLHVFAEATNHDLEINFVDRSTQRTRFDF